MRILVLAALFLAQPALSDTDGFTQRLEVTPPDGWSQVWDGGKADSYIVEYLRSGETVEDWKEMITVTGLRQPPAAGDPRPAMSFALAIKDGYQSACPESFSAYEQEAPKVPGALDVFAGNLNCGRLGESGLSQAMTFVVVAGKAEVFTYQWAEQAQPWDGGAAFDEARWAPRLQALSAGLKLCDAADQASCASE